MPLARIAWRNVKQRRLQTWITVVVTAIGLSMAMSAALLAAGLEDGLADATKPYGMLVGSKGSAHQLVFNTIYLMDTPLANLPLSYMRQLERDERVRRVVPFAMGDHYQGFRIVGTSGQFFDLRPSPGEAPAFRVADGRRFERPFEAVIGRRVARATGLAVGDEFRSGHGVTDRPEESENHADHPYVVVGVLAESGLPADAGIFVPLESYWISHGQHGAAGEAGSAGTGEEGGEKRGVTALLVEPVSYAHLMQLYADINRSPLAQAVFPGQVLAKVYDMIGTGHQALGTVGLLVLVMAVLTVLLFLYSAALEKRRPIAILRVIGAGRRRIFAMVLAETAVVLALATVLGIALTAVFSVAGSWLIGRQSPLAVKPAVSGQAFVALGVVWALGLAAAVAPALAACRTEPARHLAAD